MEIKFFTNQTNIMLPLDKHAEIIKVKFSKYVVIQETECNCMKSDALLFKKGHYPDYCYLEYNRGCDSVSFTLFKSDFSNFERIETDFMDGFSFCVSAQDSDATAKILNHLV